MDIFHVFSWTFFVQEDFSSWMHFQGRFLVGSRGHFLMVITNSANTVVQPTQGDKSVHENSLFLSTKIRPLFSQKVCHPVK